MSYTHEKYKILIVDDVPANIRTLAAILSNDYEIHVATNGKDAIETALTKDIDIILLDVAMPEMDGFEVCRRLKSNEQTNKIPVIFVTANHEEITEAQGFDIGAVDYITKPINRPVVQARVRTHLQIRTLNHNLEKSLELIRSTFGRYMSEDVVASILDTPDGLRMGGEKKEVTVMMSDLRGFTLLSERRTPEDVVSMLNMYLETMTEILMQYNGTIIEFMGDGILALFGAPISREDDAQRAVACALEMQLAMSSVNAKNREYGFPEFMMGVGLNTGLVVAGNIGSDKRTKYGVVGSAINLTSRIESLTVGGQILLSDATAQACGPILTINQSWQVMPKGVGRPITIHEVIGIGGPHAIHLSKPEKIALQPIDTPLLVRIHIMEGKHAGLVAHEGSLTALSPPLAEITSSVHAERLTNLQLELFDLQGISITNELYGKVLTEDEGDGRMTVHFTAMPPEAELAFQQLLNI